MPLYVFMVYAEGVRSTPFTQALFIERVDDIKTYVVYDTDLYNMLGDSVSQNRYHILDFDYQRYVPYGYFKIYSRSQDITILVDIEKAKQNHPYRNYIEVENIVFDQNDTEDMTLEKISKNLDRLGIDSST